MQPLHSILLPYCWEIITVWLTGEEVYRFKQFHLKFLPTGNFFTYLFITVLLSLLLPSQKDVINVRASFHLEVQVS